MINPEHPADAPDTAKRNPGSLTFVDGEYMLEVGLSFVSIRFYGMVDTGRYC